MLFRLAGKLSNGKSFSAKYDAESALAATTRLVSAMDGKTGDATVSELVVKPLEESNEVYIGDVRTPRKRRGAAADAPASDTVDPSQTTLTTDGTAQDQGTNFAETGVTSPAAANTRAAGKANARK